MDVEVYGDSKFFIKDNKKEYKCKQEGCNDTGFILVNGKPKRCTQCNTGTNNVTLDDTEVEKLSEEIQIPEKMKDIVFKSDKIRNDPKIETHIKDDPRFEYYLDMLQEIYNKINVGGKISTSIIVTAPQGLGKNHFVYSCMNSALRTGKTVAPYLDSLQIYNLFDRGWGEDLKTIEMIESSDVTFIKIPTGLTFLKQSTQTLKLVVDRRARRDLPTIVISRFPVNYLYSIEVNLDRFIVTRSYGEDYSRLRVIASSFPDLGGYDRKYIKRSR